MEKRCRSLDKEVKHLRSECAKRRRMIELQQNCLHQGKDPTTFQKVRASSVSLSWQSNRQPWHSHYLTLLLQCRHCSKTFVNKSFLMSHLLRRHPEKTAEEEEAEEDRRRRKQRSNSSSNHQSTLQQV